MKTERINENTPLSSRKDLYWEITIYGHGGERALELYPVKDRVYGPTRQPTLKWFLDEVLSMYSARSIWENKDDAVLAKVTIIKPDDTRVSCAVVIRIDNKVDSLYRLSFNHPEATQHLSRDGYNLDETRGMAKNKEGNDILLSEVFHSYRQDLEWRPENRYLMKHFCYWESLPYEADMIINEVNFSFFGYHISYPHLFVPYNLPAPQTDIPRFALHTEEVNDPRRLFTYEKDENGKPQKVSVIPGCYWQGFFKHRVFGHCNAYLVRGSDDIKHDSGI